MAIICTKHSRKTTTKRGKSLGNIINIIIFINNNNNNIVTINNNKTQTIMSDVFPKDGVTASFLCNDLVEELGGIPSLKGLTTGQVIQDKIKPKTLQWQSSYCTYLRQRNHPAYHETAHVFISHGHSYMFLDLINAIKWALRDELTTTIVWIDFCSINQHSPMDWTFEWLSTTFKSAIQGMGRTLMVMSPWNDPLPFKRTWCVYEAYCTAEKEDCKFEIALSENDEVQFLKDMIKDGIEKINKMLAMIRSEKSECGSESDREGIFAVIESSVGFSKLDSMVFECYRGWVIEVALKWLKKYTSRDKKYCDLLYVLGTLYLSQSNYIKAESYYRQALECAIALFGSDDIYVLILKSYLGDSLGCQLKYDEALKNFHACFDQCQAILGDDHEQTLTVMNSLANLFSCQDNYDKAEDLYCKCLEKYKAQFGEDDQNTLNVMTNLADVFRCQGKNKEAEDLLRPCLEKRQANLGNNHPGTLWAMICLARALQNQCKYTEAETMIRTCFEQRERILGMGHESTLTAQNYLGRVLCDQGKFREAEETCRACLGQHKISLGIDHPHSSTLMYNLAYVLYKQGKYTEAEELLQTCLEKRKATLGETHPNTLKTIKCLEICRRKMSQDQPTNKKQKVN